MTRLDPNPPAGSADPGFAAIEAALSTLAEPAPARLGHAVLVRVGLADDYAAIDSPLGPLRVAWNARGVSAVDGSTEDREFEQAFLARTGRRASRDGLPAAATRPGRRAAACRRPSRPDRPRPPRLDRVRAGGLAQGPRDPPRRGPAVRLDRSRDRPAEGGPGRRDGARPQPDPAHRSVPPRRPDRRLHRQVLARRAGRTSGRSSPSRAPTRTAWRGSPAPASATIGSDTTRIFCMPTCHDARRIDRRGHKVRFHSSREACGRRLPALPALPAGGRRREPPEPASAPRPAIAGGPARLAQTLDQPTMPTSDRTEPAPRALVWLAILILYFVWGSTYLGIRIAVESIPPFRWPRRAS